jgi:hypothetical protein
MLILSQAIALVESSHLFALLWQQFNRSYSPANPEEKP